MQNFINWFLNAARREVLGQAEINAIETELNDLMNWRNTMPHIEASDWDKLTADVTANAQAMTDVKSFAGTLQGQIATATAEMAAMKQQLADEGSAVDVSSVLSALEASTATAQGIVAATAAVTPPVVPAPVDSTGADTTGTPTDMTGTPDGTVPGPGV